MKKLILLLALLPSLAHAQSYYDYRTGSTYNQAGNTTTGYNSRTGSSWTTTQTPSGAYGRDASGNSWNYNHTTGAYSNTNGTSCYGFGANRRCY